MCVIIYKPHEKDVTKKTLNRCWQSNPDGAGFMYASAGDLHVEKGFFKFKALYRALRKAESANEKSDFVIHFRIATSGKISSENCHPFAIDKTGIAHNGIFSSIKVPAKSADSDTALFCKNILAHLPKDWLSNKGMIALVEKYCRANRSKMVALNGYGKHHIFAENLGTWQGGVWFSNDGALWEKTKIQGLTNSWACCIDDTTTATKSEKSFEHNDTYFDCDFDYCDGCGDVFSLSELRTAYVDHIYVSLCKDCRREYLTEYDSDVPFGPSYF